MTLPPEGNRVTRAHDPDHKSPAPNRQDRSLSAVVKEREKPASRRPATGLERAAPNVSEVHGSVISLSSIAAAAAAF